MAAPNTNSTSDRLGRSFNDDDEFARYIQTWLGDGCMCCIEIERFELVCFLFSSGSVNHETTSVMNPSATPSNNAHDSVGEYLCQHLFPLSKFEFEGAAIVQQQQNKIIDDVLLMSNNSFETIVKTEYKTEALQLPQTLHRNVETTHRELSELDAPTTDSTGSSASTSSSSDDAFPWLLPP